ncbi:MAG: hypothetical protein KJS97_10525 [Alphaproteobacteria bacterium]|nr:hypothetical protein [Alphaproteobacteria bacterium]
MRAEIAPVAALRVESVLPPPDVSRIEPELLGGRPKARDRDPPLVTAPHEPTPKVALPLAIDGQTVGEIEVTIDFARPEAVSVPHAALLSALTGRLTPEAYARIAAALGSAPEVKLPLPPTALIDVEVDMEQALVRVTRRLEDIPVRRVSGAWLEEETEQRASLQPARVSAALNASITGRYDWRAPNGKAWLPTEGVLDGFIAVGGANSVVLRSAARFVGGSVERQLTTVIYDDPARAIRYRLGEFDPEGAQFQTRARLRGLTIGRNYRELQPLFSLAPTGRTQLDLDRDATVSIEVDGVVTTTTKMRRGRYDVRDLTDTYGSHRVRVLVEDDFGLREAANLDVYADPELLAKDVSEFSFALGQIRDMGIKDNAFVATGYYRWAAAPRLTALLGAEKRGDDTTAVAEALTPIPGGTLRAAFGLSSINGADGQRASIATYQSMNRPHQGRLFLSTTTTTESARAGYIGVEAAAAADARRAAEEMGVPDPTVFMPKSGIRLASTIQAGYRNPRQAFDISAQYRDLRDREPSWSVSSAASRFMGGMTLTLMASYRRDELRGDDARLTLGLAFSRSVRGGSVNGFVTRNNQSAQLQTPRRDMAGGQGQVTARLQNTPTARNTTIDANWYGPRFSVLTQQQMTSGGRASRVMRDRNISSATLAFGVGYADGVVAIGHPIYDAFAIAQRDPSLRSATVYLGSANDRIKRRSGVLGAPLTSLVPYQTSNIAFDIENLPDGYALGAVETTVTPRLGSGYVLRIGSPNWMSAQGRLIDGDTPLSGRRIVIVPKSRAKGEKPLPPIETFTNASGLFYVEGVGPGDYAIRAGDTELATFSIAPAKDALVDLGSLKVTS